MTITPDTQVTIGVALTCIATAVTCTWTLARKWAKLEDQMDALTDKFGDSYTLTRACEVALRHAIEDPTHRVPDPRDPRRVISVNEHSRDIRAS